MAVQNNTYANMQEEELKNKIRNDFFDYKDLDADKIIGKIDFCVSLKKSQDKANNLAQDNTQDSNMKDFGDINLLWAEAKKGKSDLITSFIQLILTIGKNKMLNDNNPPKFLGAFDAEKMAFVKFEEVAPIFHKNDFNWNVTPSNHASKEFKELKDLLEDSLQTSQMRFVFSRDEKDLRQFIKANFDPNNAKIIKTEINKNNFILIYQKWVRLVKPSIIADWAEFKRAKILDSDFFLADMLSSENETLKDKLEILLKINKYHIVRPDKIGKVIREIYFSDKQIEHTIFWSHYERPPLEEYWDYIITRRDTLVPSDVRERKGSFFTPQIWVEKAQEYLASAFGKDYQGEYFIWDCAAGTGNLLFTLHNKDHLFASTIDNADVNIMKDLADSKSLIMWPNHIFQFDFLNDSFFDEYCERHKITSDTKKKDVQKILNARKECEECDRKKSKLPAALQEILLDPAKREKLIVFINPPYAEATTSATVTGTGKNKDGVATNNNTYEKYKTQMGKASNELFAQFFFRIYNELSGCKLASFSTTKYLNAPNFIRFREMFKARFLKGFLCPSFTFDNVNGSFPIAFIVWDLAKKQEIKKTRLDVFSCKKVKLEMVALKGKKVEIKKLDSKKVFYAHSRGLINQWIKSLEVTGDVQKLGVVHIKGNDFQNQQGTFLLSNIVYNNHATNLFVTKHNLIPSMIYLAIRHCIKHTWLNNGDRFLAPKKSWAKDSEFHINCLVFSLFHWKNRISSLDGINYFIPFSETEINAKEAFASEDFMYKFLQGKIKTASHNGTLDVKGTTLDLLTNLIPQKPVIFSESAQKVMDAGRALFTYYHESASQPPKFSFDDGYNRSYNANVSLYDIKAHFQGFKNKKMNPPQKAQDEHYNILLSDLNNALENLADEIAQKCYEHEFLLD